jgi:ABC-2 type transport system ATP-binding protein
VILLRAEAIGKVFGSAVALRDVNLALRRGTITGLVGRNGAGKTTLLRILAGALEPSEGRVWRAPNARVGLALDRDVALYADMSVERYLRCMARLSGRRDTVGPSQVMDWLGLTARGHQEIRTLSRGFRQRVLVGQALLGSPDVVLLDEPLNSLDPVQISEVSALIRTLPWRPAILVSSHIVAHVIDLVDEVAVMATGALAAQGPLAEFFGSHSPKGRPAVSITVAGSEHELRRAVDGRFTLDDIVVRGGLTRAIVHSDTDAAMSDVDRLAAETMACLADAALPVVEVRPRHLGLGEFV